MRWGPFFGLTYLFWFVFLAGCSSNYGLNKHLDTTNIPPAGPLGGLSIDRNRLAHVGVSVNADKRCLSGVGTAEDGYTYSSNLVEIRKKLSSAGISGAKGFYGYVEALSVTNYSLETYFEFANYFSRYGHEVFVAGDVARLREIVAATLLLLKNYTDNEELLVAKRRDDVVFYSHTSVQPRLKFILSRLNFMLWQLIGEEQYLNRSLHWSTPSLGTINKESRVPYLILGDMNVNSWSWAILYPNFLIKALQDFVRRTEVDGERRDVSKYLKSYIGIRHRLLREKHLLNIPQTGITKSSLMIDFVNLAVFLGIHTTNEQDVAQLRNDALQLSEQLFDECLEMGDIAYLRRWILLLAISPQESGQAQLDSIRSALDHLQGMASSQRNYHITRALGDVSNAFNRIIAQGSIANPWPLFNFVAK